MLKVQESSLIYDFSYPWSVTVQKQMILPLTYLQKFNSSSLKLCHNAYIIHLAHLITQTSHSIPRRVNAV